MDAGGGLAVTPALAGSALFAWSTRSAEVGTTAHTDIRAGPALRKVLVLALVSHLDGRTGRARRVVLAGVLVVAVEAAATGRVTPVAGRALQHRAGAAPPVGFFTARDSLILVGGAIITILAIRHDATGFRLPVPNDPEGIVTHQGFAVGLFARTAGHGAWAGGAIIRSVAAATIEPVAAIALAEQGLRAGLADAVHLVARTLSIVLSGAAAGTVPAAAVQGITGREIVPLSPAAGVVLAGPARFCPRRVPKETR